jgi:HAE1 family hydrophobic/amphiphilic exporter-1
MGVLTHLNDPEIAGAIKVGYPETVSLGDIAAIETVTRPSSIQRLDGKMTARITGTISASDVGAVNRLIEEKISAITLPEGVDVGAAGVAEDMKNTFSDMKTAILVAIALAFLVMLATFRSLKNSLLVMASLPMASIGAFLALLLTSHTLSATGMMGLLMLVGIVLTNAIVLISVVGQLREEGKSVREALTQGSRTRLRPILMTAITTMIAMVPLVIGMGGSGIMMASDLAIVVIGGLFSSTILTLLVIPAIYSTIYDRKKKQS